MDNYGHKVTVYVGSTKVEVLSNGNKTWVRVEIFPNYI